MLSKQIIAARPASCIKHVHRLGYEYYVLQFDVPSRWSRLRQMAAKRGMQDLRRRLYLQRNQWERVTVVVNVLNQSTVYNVKTDRGYYVHIPASAFRLCVKKYWGVVIDSENIYPEPT